MSFLKKTSVYLVSNIVNAAIPFVLLPILTRYLSPSDYGQIAMFQTLLAGISSFIGCNSVGAANRKYYDGNVDDVVLKQFNGSCFQILTFSSLLAVALICVFYEELSQILAIPGSWVLGAVVVSMLTFITTMRLGQWQIRGQAKLFGFLQVSNSFINMILSLVFVITLSQGAEGRIFAQFISVAFIAMVSVVWLYKDKLLQVCVWKPEYVKEALLFGLPLVPHTLGGFMVNGMDRLLINDKLGLTEAGVYMVAVQLSSALTIIFDGINKAYAPWLFEKLKIGNMADKKNIVKYTYVFFLVVLVLAALSFVLGPIAISILAGDEYQKAGDVIGWLCLGQVFVGMYFMVTNYVFYAKKTGGLATITLISGVVNIGLLIVLLPYFGLTGAAISFAAAQAFQFILTWLLASRSIDMPWCT